MKKYNFSAGPSVLPEEVLDKTSKAILNYNETGLSILEVSHRGKDFMATIEEAHQAVKDVLNVPEGYSVVFMGGGASLQFAMVPLNLLERKAAYLNTGVWADKAVKEAKGIGEVVEVASSKDKNYSYIPKNYVIPTDVDYFHITTNNTIYGTEIHYDMDSPVPLVADMSSDIFSRPVDISKYALIYAGAQKNLSCAGVTLAIVRNDILGKVSRYIPTMLRYQAHIDNGSMYNTPPVFPIFTALQTLNWIKAKGGLSVMYEHNKKKAAMLYSAIDNNPLFRGTAAVEDRSLMNVSFVMADAYKELEKEFLDFATSRGMVSIKGHRTTGGFRASIYNAMPIESVQALIDCMNEFARIKG